MADLIDRDAAIAIAERYGCNNGSVLGKHSGVADCIASELAKLPAVDAEPVKRGRWIEVSGYVTPGGDPVWKCSECGKGVHVYGIEASSYQGDVSDQQWVACPNCGAKMEVE